MASFEIVRGAVGRARVKAHWFAVTMVFMSRIGKSRTLRPLCEERIVLFRADSKSEAGALGRKHGRSEEHSYEAVNGKRVTWSFIGIESIDDVTQHESNGPWEIGSRYVRRSLKRLKELEPSKRGASI